MNKKQLIVTWVQKNISKIIVGVIVGLILYPLGVKQGAKIQGTKTQVTGDGNETLSQTTVFNIENLNYNSETKEYKVVYREATTQDTVTLVSGTVGILPMEFKKPLDQFLRDNDIMKEVSENKVKAWVTLNTKE